MKVIILPCAQCNYSPDPACDFCERYRKWLARLGPGDVVITEIVDSDKAVNITCPHCKRWFRIG